MLKYKKHNIINFSNREQLTKKEITMAWTEEKKLHLRHPDLVINDDIINDDVIVDDKDQIKSRILLK